MPRKEVSLKLHAPQANKVSLAGSFNNWNTTRMQAKKDRKGTWNINLSLNPGKYEYKFVVDGSWITDPSCRETVYNSFGSTNSVMVVK